MRRVRPCGLRDKSPGFLGGFGAGNQPCTIGLLCILTTIAAPAQTFKTLVTFDGPNGASLSDPPIQGLDGNFYGTTIFGGANFGGSDAGAGTVFKMTPAGAVTTLYTFCLKTNCPDGSAAETGLVLGTDGNFYGVTYGGGASNDCSTHTCGTVFKITPSGILTTLHSFCTQTNCSDGFAPETALIQAVDGNFYGVTYGGGAYGDGTLFRITKGGQLTTLCSFGASSCPGSGPNGLVQGIDGNFYGTTGGGGKYRGGTFFEMTLSGIMTTRYSFGGTRGSAPTGGLVQGSDGNFYGTTSSGGANHMYGTVFKISPKGGHTRLYSFCAQPNCTDGAIPWFGVGLVQGTDGDFYGTTTFGGSSTGCSFGRVSNAGCGTIFKITSGGVFTTLYNFCSQANCTDGGGPYAGLVQGTNGNFYGSTYGGGTASCGSPCRAYGTIFSLSTGLGPFVEAAPYTRTVGKKVEILGRGLTATTAVSFNGTPASFIVQSDTYLTATVPVGGTTGFITVTTPSGLLTSNKPFHVLRH